MLHRWTAALILAGLVTGAPNGAVCAWAQAADSFEVVPRPQESRSPHRAAWGCAIAGAGLVAASFPLSHLADRRYAEYLDETDTAAIDARYRATVRADHLASASLVAGEALIVSAVWLRFVHRAPPRASLVVLPDRCAVRLRF
jgi:hypothetical protein